MSHQHLPISSFHFVAGSNTLSSHKTLADRTSLLAPTLQPAAPKIPHVTDDVRRDTYRPRWKPESLRGKNINTTTVPAAASPLHTFPSCPRSPLLSLLRPRLATVAFDPSALTPMSELSESRATNPTRVKVSNFLPFLPFLPRAVTTEPKDSHLPDQTTHHLDPRPQA